MASVINFSAEWKDTTPTNIQMDTDISCLVYDIAGTLQDTLTLTSTPTAITYDATNIYYHVDELDVTAYPVGNITCKWYAKKGAVNTYPYPLILTVEHPDESTTGQSTYTTLVDDLKLVCLEDNPGDELTTARARALLKLALKHLSYTRNVEQYDGVTLVADLLDPAVDPETRDDLVVLVAKHKYFSNPRNLVGFTDNNVERRTAEVGAMLRQLQTTIDNSIKSLKRVHNTTIVGLVERSE